MEGVIYLATNKIDGNCYIGKTVQSFKRRKMNHFAHAKRGCTFYFHRALRKYGENSFKWEILAMVDTEEKLDQLEKCYIEDIKKTKKLYNMTDGGEGTSGRIKSTEERKKLSIANKGQVPWIKGKHLTDEHKKKLSAAKKNPSEETRRRMRIASKGRNLGRKLTEDHKKKISEAGKNRITSLETRKKLSESKKGVSLSLETRKKISESLKLYNMDKRNKAS